MRSAGISGALLALALPFTAAGVASAQPSTAQQAHTWMTLDVVSLDDSGAKRASLECYPSIRGSHPAAASACGDLRAVRGDLDLLPKDEQTMCPAVWQPVIASAHGVWCDREVSWSKQFGNSCELARETASVFAF